VVSWTPPEFGSGARLVAEVFLWQIAWIKIKIKIKMMLLQKAPSPGPRCVAQIAAELSSLELELATFGFLEPRLGTLHLGLA
jgi:hypothetical protein